MSRGGTRPGAGRKPTGRKTARTIRLTSEQWAALDQLAGDLYGWSVQQLCEALADERAIALLELKPTGESD